MGQLARDYGLPLGITALVLIVLVVLARLFASRGIASGLWRGIRANRATTLLLSLALLLGVGLSIYFERASYAESLRRYASSNLLTAGNLLADPQLTSLGTLTSSLSTWTTNMPLPTRRASSSSR